jgi:hypothetical protein
MLLVKIFPVLSGTSYASRGAYYNQASGPRSGLSASGRHDVRIASAKRPDSDEESPTGIRFQKSYVVQFSDRENDESSLVQMSDLEPPAKAWRPDP